MMAKKKTSKHTEVEIFVALRVVDRVMLTARQTLVERLGVGEMLKDLRRRDYFRLAVAGETDEAMIYTGDIVANTAVFANPNKETYEIAPLERPLSAGDNYVVLVYPREGLFDESLCRFLALDLGYDRIIAAGRGVAWTVELAAGVDRKYVEEIIVAADRTRGLLANPHAERHEII
jgi:hypothetical protein